MSLHKFRVSVIITTIVLLTVASIGQSASAHRRNGHHGHGHGHGHGHEHRHGKKICYGVPPHQRCVPVTHR